MLPNHLATGDIVVYVTRELDWVTAQRSSGGDGRVPAYNDARNLMGYGRPLV